MDWNTTGTVDYVTVSLVPRLLPSFLSHTVCNKKLGRSLGMRLCHCSTGNGTFIQLQQNEQRSPFHTVFSFFCIFPFYQTGTSSLVPSPSRMPLWAWTSGNETTVPQKSLLNCRWPLATTSTVFQSIARDPRLCTEDIKGKTVRNIYFLLVP